MEELSQSNDRCKMLCRLEQDVDGYPPVSVEGLWVRPLTPERVSLDSIPFFARGLAPGDELAVEQDEGGEIWFRCVVKSAGGSVFRIHPDKTQSIDEIRGDMLDLGMPTEVDRRSGLIAVEVPVGVDIRPLIHYLMEGQAASRFDFEEAVLRHGIPD